LNLYFDMDPRRAPPIILDDIEQLNIEIPSNKEEVRQYHMLKLEALLNELNDVKAPLIENEEDLKRELEKDAELEKETTFSDDSEKPEYINIYICIYIYIYINVMCIAWL
jgi:hypothetical protein